MSTKKYTPAPWIDNVEETDERLNCIYNQELDQVIADNIYGKDKEQAAANMRLMTQSPDMHELLIQAFDYFTNNNMIPANHKLQIWLDKTKAVFEKVDE